MLIYILNVLAYARLLLFHSLCLKILLMFEFLLAISTFAPPPPSPPPSPIDSR